MTIHGISVVKNEVDIIGQSLLSAMSWCDYIYILDNGSTDGTWELIKDMAKLHKQLIIYKQDFRPFRHSFRRDVFNQYRSRSSDGDWWCARLDSDEFYIDNPQDFLKKVPEKYHTIWNASFQYYFTDQDADDFKEDPSLYADDKPIHERCRYYQNDWSEGRFFRYNSNLVWPEERDWPICGAIYPQRIRLKHYKYRSPQQIQTRIKIRLEARARGSSSFSHESRGFQGNSMIRENEVELRGDEWKSTLVKASTLNFDTNNGEYMIREDLMPSIPIYNRIPTLSKLKMLMLKLSYDYKNNMKSLRSLNLRGTKDSRTPAGTAPLKSDF